LQAQQQSSDSWHSATGSSALSIVNALFDVNNEFNTNEAQQNFPTNIIESLGFVYKNIDSEVSDTLSCTIATFY
jgi:hypothetical protein